MYYFVFFYSFICIAWVNVAGVQRKAAGESIACRPLIPVFLFYGIICRTPLDARVN